MGDEEGAANGSLFGMAEHQPQGQPGASSSSTPGAISSVVAIDRKDYDPPPGYDGVDPTSTYKGWRRAFVLWTKDTDVPLRKRGRKVLAAMKGDAAAIVGTLIDEELLRYGVP